jgi:hypothetical protein
MPNNFYSGESNSLAFVNNLTLVSCKPSLKQLIAVFFMLLVWSIPKLAVCADTLQSVMSRMKPDSAVAINYQENRYLSLMSDKWRGSGRFYALFPDVMIKEQQQPEKHQGEMTDTDSPAAYIAAFKGLINGDSSSLTKLYDIEFIANSSGWTITLITKKSDTSNEGIKIIMQGPPEQAANKLELIMADGDRTEFLLGPTNSGEAVKSRTIDLIDLQIKRVFKSVSKLISSIAMCFKHINCLHRSF